MVHILLKPGLENFEHCFASMWDECSCVVFWTFFGTAFLWDWNESWRFPVLWPLLSFTDLLAYWVQYFHSIVFRIWNSSTGIQSPSLALFIVMLPKAHLTSHSRMSGWRWVITPSWSSGSRRYFLYSSSVYSCYLLLISSASVRSTLVLSFIVPIFAWNIPLVSLNFLEEISSFSHSIVFLYFFALITEEGFLISPCYSLELCIQMGGSFLFSFAFCFSSFLNYLWGLFRQPFCLFAFLFLGDDLHPWLLYNVMNLCP